MSLKRLFFLVAGIILAGRAVFAADLSRPNIIIVMPDDLGYGDYACLGNPITHTPCVDAFKKESLLFTQFHVSPTCAPTRSALMSGRHEFKNGVTHTIMERERMSLDSVTVAQMLKSVGYTTGIFGKWHLGDEEPYQPNNRGFDEVYIHGGGGIGQHFNGSCGDVPGNNNINPTLWHNGKFEKNTGYCTDLFFAQAIKWMDGRRQANAPFFAYITPNAAHVPHVVPLEYYRQYLGKPGVTEDIAKFFGMVENIDTNFGRLLQKLQEWGIAHNTLVIYLGTDNGGTAGVPIFNAGMRGHKGTPYQGGTRSPCFVRWPAAGVPAGVECDALTAHIDIFPTLAAITGATLTDKMKRQLEGHSLLPLLKNPATAWDRTLMLEHHVGRWPLGQAAQSEYLNCSIQDAQYELVDNQELYDLKADLGESRNVLAQHPDEVAKLRATYEQWWQDVQPLLVNEDAYKTAPLLNPFAVLYWKQFGGGPIPGKAGEGLNKRYEPSSKKAKGKPKTDAVD